MLAQLEALLGKKSNPQQNAQNNGQNQPAQNAQQLQNDKQNLGMTGQQTDNNNPAGGKNDPNAQQQQTENPLDQFKDLWKAGENQNDPNAPLFKYDNAKLSEAVGKMDFTKAVDPALVQKALGGGADAGPALMQLMNSIAQASFSQALVANSQLVDRGISTKLGEFGKTVDGKIKNFAVGSAIQSANPAFSHPAVAPIITSLQQQLQAQNPNASPEEIKQSALDYLSKVANLVSQKDDGNNGGDVNDVGLRSNSRNQKQETDWGSFFS